MAKNPALLLRLASSAIAPRHGSRFAGRIVGFGVLALLAGCLVAGDPSVSEEKPDIDALRAQPYLDHSPTRAANEVGGVVLDRQESHPGFNLVSLFSLCKADLFDARGRVVRSWQSERCQHWSNAEILPMGDLFVTGSDTRRRPEEVELDDRMPADARFLLRFDFAGDLVWKAQLPVHHDIALTPGNELLTLTFRDRRVEGRDALIRDNSIALVSLDGKLLEELSLYDLFSADPERFPLQDVKARGKNRKVDLLHANSVEWIDKEHLAGRDPIYRQGNVLVSIRHQDVVVIANWERRELVWMWGRGELLGPHDATLLENGNMMIFDNGLGRGWSRVVEIDPVAGEIVWEYRAPEPTDFYSASKGSSQRLANGNTLITNSDSGQVFEVTPAGERVWEYLNPHLNRRGHRRSLVRTKRYESDFIERLHRRRGGTP